MKVKDFISYLENGELATAFDKFSDADDYQMLLSNINVSLLTLYTDLPLLEKHVYLQRFPHIANYVLDSRYAVSNTRSTEIYKYILDTEENPFQDDVIAIRFAYTPFGEIMINDYNNPTRSWFVSGKTIQIPNTMLCGEIASVCYQAKHPEVFSPDDELQIPEFITEGFLAYVSSRMFLTRTDERASQLAANYLEKYKSEVDRVRENNLLSQFTVTNIRPIRGGWV